jgi:hypothetical protein
MMQCVLVCEAVYVAEYVAVYVAVYVAAYFEVDIAVYVAVCSTQLFRGPRRLFNRLQLVTDKCDIDRRCSACWCALRCV